MSYRGSQETGISPEMAIEVFNEIKEHYTSINLQGVMSIGAHTQDEEKIIKSFEITNDIAKVIETPIISMGMSSDFEIAIKNGSNMVRVGSALFKA